MKRILLFIICVGLALGADAQLRFGVKAGGTLSNLTGKSNGEKLEGYKAKLGFQLGGLMEYSFTESFTLQPELLFVSNGAKAEMYQANGDALYVVDSKIILQNIQVPINLKYKMGTDNLKFYVTAGPYFGYIVSAKQKASNRGVDVSVNLYDNNDFKMKHFDFGLGVGFGVEITKIMVGVGYQYGIANLTGADNASVKSGTFNLSVGYLF